MNTGDKQMIFFPVKQGVEQGTVPHSKNFRVEQGTVPHSKNFSGFCAGVFGGAGVRRYAGACVLLMSALFLMMCLSGCGERKAGRAFFTVYYLNAEKNALALRKTELKAESEYGRAEEMLDLLGKTPEEEGLKAPISGFTRKEFSIDNHVIMVDFTRGYRNLDIITEKLVRAAIVRTLCEIPDVHRVTIRVNGALLVDERGNKSENMTAEQFIYNSGKEMLNFERTQLHLYFASEDGTKLISTYRKIVYNGNIPMDRLVVEQIIKGPKASFSYPTVNENTKVINVVSRDNICTVTLDRTFLTNPYKVSPEVALYSIVNSLTELASIHQVQIIIDGEEAPLFMDKFTLNSENLLQNNTKLVELKDGG